MSGGNKYHQGISAEEKLLFTQAILDNTTEALFWMEPGGKFLEVNPAACRIYGYSREELLTMGVADIDPGMKDGVPPEMAEATRIAGFGKIETVHSRKDGSLFPCEILVVYVDRDGKAYHCGFVRDITERKKNEERLRFESEITAKMAEGVILVDPSTWEIIYANEKYLHMFGYTQSELLGKSLDILNHPSGNGIRKLAKEISGVLAGKGEWNGELMNARKDGSSFWSRATITPFDHSVYGKVWISVQADITQQRISELALRESEERFRNAFENVATGMVLTSLKGQFLQINQAMCKMLGYSREELEKKAFKDITHPDDLSASLEIVTKLIEGAQGSFQVEKRYIHKKGEIIWGYLTVSLLRNNDNEPLYFIAQIQNITERKVAEQKLQEAKAQAEEATRLKDKFVSLVAHDLKSPLASIIGLLNFMLKNTADPLSEKQSEVLRKLVNSGESMFNMIDDLLNIGRLHTGAVKVNKGFFDLSSLVNAIVEDYEYSSNLKGIRLENSIPRGVRVYADLPLLKELFQNLVSNAIKFCGYGDLVQLGVERLSPVTITVSDNGKGIAKSMLPHLFKHEEKTSTIGTSGERGTGLGLPFSHDIITAHGGTLRVTSEEGLGSVFKVELPAIRPVILLVDDQIEVRKLIKAYLETLEVDVREVTNGKEALDFFLQVKPHLVICDLLMPEMDGFELLSRLKSDPGMKSVPVLVITAGGMESRDKSFQYGANDFVQKPIQAEEFLPRVRRLLYSMSGKSR